ncbi:hypothetical protein ACMD2_26270 [Ananas comosus]|uniref:Uncharacterized protein n=1 Tax=Ananas comosus TaxID=4615 RepID=A0A199VS97_ANACO|nr:hypothetical protein ACMD2_26270 [Ananas comosus]
MIKNLKSRAWVVTSYC